MNNIKITHTTLEYEDLPDDDKCRIVWWYGGIVKNPSHRSTTPLIEILFRTLSTEQELLHESFSEVIILPFSALDCFKIGSIWKGKKISEIYGI